MSELEQKYEDEAIKIMLDFTASSNWDEMAELNWNSAEVEELIKITLRKANESNTSHEQNALLVDVSGCLSKTIQVKFGYKTIATDEDNPNDWWIKTDTKVGDIINLLK